MEILEILAWNVFIVSAVMFLAQGAGIIMHWFQKIPSIHRIVLSIVLVILLFTPINVFLFGAILLLGIIECWVPFRVAKNT